MPRRLHTWKNSIRILLYSAIVALTCTTVSAEDWPAYAHDAARSAVSADSLQLPLFESWRHETMHPPQPAWPPPAINNYWHRLHGLNPAVTYDRAFHIVVKDKKAYFASSADDKLYCLDTENGKTLWTFFTEAPVRFAPTIANKKIYIGSDDGVVYCLTADTGKLLWKHRAVDQDYRLPGNGRIMSLWPIRTGVLADKDTVYFCAGLFPTEGAYLCALDAADGSPRYKHKIDISPEGYILASTDKLFVPTGRTGPAVFDKSNGKSLGQISSPGGSFALVADNTLVSGPGRGTGNIAVSDITAKSSLASFDGLRMVVKGDFAYMQNRQSISAINRTKYLDLTQQIRTIDARRKDTEKKLKAADNKQTLAAQLEQLNKEKAALNEQAKKCLLWKKPLNYPYALIMAGDILLAGGQDKIAAVNPSDGTELWTATVNGKAWSLAVANGKLYVSTDQGVIHCFHNKKNPPRWVQTQTSATHFENRKDTYPHAAKRITDQMQGNKGYCLLLNSRQDAIACLLAKTTDLKIICVEKDKAKVDQYRKTIDAAGHYGRAVVHHITSDKLPYPDYFANIIIADSEQNLPFDREEILRLLRPEGGIASFIRAPSVHIQRPPLEGAGQWTHQHADPANTACSKDDLVKGPMQLQWFGNPGPREMIDRHHRNVAPLYKAGRLFVPGDNVVWALDAYNGTIKWKQNIPDSRRLGVFLDSGSMVVDEKHLYVVAQDQCHAFDVETGRKELTHTMPQLKSDRQQQWGYIAHQNELLYGSGRKPHSTYTETSYDADSALWYRDMRLVTSDSLFAMDRSTGKVKWTFAQGTILNTTITLGPKRIYFIQTTSPKASAGPLGRMPTRDLFDGGAQYLVALDAQTGKPIYKKQIDTSKIQEPVYLNLAQNVLLFSGSEFLDKHIHYYYYAFDAPTGDPTWQADHNSELATDGGHGEYNRHPTIIDDTVYAWPYAYELKTGKRIDGWKFARQGHGCGGVSASSHAMFWRGHNPWMYDLTPGGGPTRLNKATRPGCWINIIPAGGLVLIPEASSGCTCGYPIQTSLAYRPVN